MAELTEVQRACFYTVIRYLNDQDDKDSHVYACGHLGILHVWFDRVWRNKWYEPETVPREAWLVVEADSDAQRGNRAAVAEEA